MSKSYSGSVGRVMIADELQNISQTGVKTWAVKITVIESCGFTY